MFGLMLFLIPKYQIKGALIAIGISSAINLGLFSWLMHQQVPKLIQYRPLLLRMVFFVISILSFLVLKAFIGGLVASWLDKDNIDAIGRSVPEISTSYAQSLAAHNPVFDLRNP